MQIYPDIGLQLFRFSIIPRNYYSFSLFFYPFVVNDKLGNHWADANNRKEFFDNFAKEHDFDPLVPENWYQITTKEMREIKVSTEQI